MLAGAGLWPLTSLGMWTIAGRQDDLAIGHGGIFDFLRDSDPPLTGKAEMGWILAPEAQGKGYAREACDAMLDWFEEQHGRQDIWALISPGNDPSMKLARKLGFIRQPDGIYRGKPETFWLRPASPAATAATAPAAA
jgi:RimJ/RimL family protein N-acetyltransferase